MRVGAYHAHKDAENAARAAFLATSAAASARAVNVRGQIIAFGERHCSLCERLYANT